MYIINLERPVRQPFLDDVTAVGGCVDQNIGGASRETALQHSLERGVARVVVLKRKVVNKDNELQRQMRQLFRQLRKLRELLLGHFHNAQPLTAIGVGHRLDGGAFTRAHVAVEQAVVAALAREEGACVVVHLSALPLIARKVVHAHRVVVQHGADVAVAPDKRLIAREHAAAVFAVPPRGALHGAVKQFERLGAGAALPAGQAVGDRLNRVVTGVCLQHLLALQGRGGKNSRAVAFGGAEHSLGKRSFGAARCGAGEAVFIKKRRFGHGVSKAVGAAAFADKGEKLPIDAQKHLGGFVKGAQQAVIRARHAAVQNSPEDTQRGQPKSGGSYFVHIHQSNRFLLYPFLID